MQDDIWNNSSIPSSKDGSWSCHCLLHTSNCIKKLSRCSATHLRQLQIDMQWIVSKLIYKYFCSETDSPYFAKLLKTIIYLLEFKISKIKNHKTIVLLDFMSNLDNYSAAIYWILNYYSATGEILVESLVAFSKCYFRLHIFLRFQFHILSSKKLVLKNVGKQNSIYLGAIPYSHHVICTT